MKLYLNRQQIEKVRKFKYLRWITQDCDPNTEIKTHIEIVKEIFIKLKRKRYVTEN